MTQAKLQADVTELFGEEADPLGARMSAYQQSQQITDPVAAVRRLVDTCNNIYAADFGSTHHEITQGKAARMTVHGSVFPRVSYRDRSMYSALSDDALAEHHSNAMAHARAFAESKHVRWLTPAETSFAGDQDDEEDDCEAEDPGQSMGAAAGVAEMIKAAGGAGSDEQVAMDGMETEF